MSDEILNGAAAESQAQPQAASFTVEKLYVKDLSFEAPNAPQVFNEQGQPDLQMKLSQKVNRLAEAADLLTSDIDANDRIKLSRRAILEDEARARGEEIPDRGAPPRDEQRRGGRLGGRDGGRGRGGERGRGGPRRRD